MVRNDAMPEITVDPETYQVTVDGETRRASSPPDELPMAQLYFLV